MMRRCFIPFLVVFLLLSGCSGINSIQDLTYIVSVGMDYDKEKDVYTAYIQGLNFANVAKQEGGKSPEPPPNFIASAKGETLNLAVSKLYKKTEPPLFFGHVSTLVLGKNIVIDHFQEVVEEIGRNRSLRHTLRIMTTEESLEDVFNVNALFNYPEVYTILYRYDENELFQDEIQPMTLMYFLRRYFEPIGVAKLPTVKIDKSSWKAKVDYPTVYFDGYDIFQQQKYIEKIPFDDAIIINWLQEQKVAINRKVEKDGKLVAAVKISTPKMKVKYEKGKNRPKFSIEISAQADLLEKIEDIPVNELEKIMGQELKKKITKIYEKGVENETDLLDIGDKWYRKHPKQYEVIKNTKSFYLEKDSLKSVKVKVSLFHFNGYKYNRRAED